MIIKCIWSIDIWMIVPIRREVVKFQFIKQLDKLEYVEQMNKNLAR